METMANWAGFYHITAYFVVQKRKFIINQQFHHLLPTTQRSRPGQRPQSSLNRRNDAYSPDFTPSYVFSENLVKRPRDPSSCTLGFREQLPPMSRLQK